MSHDWKTDEVARPRTVVQMIPIDRERRILSLHRSENVRSARNVWSFPSGEHEIGESLATCARRELEEEFGLGSMECNVEHLGVYENIAGDPEPGAKQYHWVLNVVGIFVPGSVTQAINKEPDKHDQVITPHVGELADPDWWTNHPFHSSFHTYAFPRRWDISMALSNLVSRVTSRR